MSPADFNFDAIPEPRREAFADFARALAELAGDDLLGLSAFGGWAVDDRCFANELARRIVEAMEKTW